MQVGNMEHIGRGLEKIVLDCLQQAPAAAVPLRLWPMVCGSAVAARTHAFSFENGVLEVEVGNSGWKSELQSLAPRYLAVLNQYLPGTVRRIEFVVAQPIPVTNPR
jgi:Dna[CI] antecedent, DciA